MADFPSIEASEYPLGHSTIAGTVKTEFEAGYVQTRPRFTRTRKRFVLKWSMMTAADYDTLDAFFISMNGAANYFNWTHPISSTVYIVRFENDELNFNLSTPGVSGFYEGSITLTEV